MNTQTRLGHKKKNAQATDSCQEFSSPHSVRRTAYIYISSITLDGQESVRHCCNCITVVEWWEMLVLGERDLCDTNEPTLACIWMQFEVIILIYQKRVSAAAPLCFLRWLNKSIRAALTQQIQAEHTSKKPSFQTHLKTTTVQTIDWFMFLLLWQRVCLVW